MVEVSKQPPEFRLAFGIVDLNAVYEEDEDSFSSDLNIEKPQIWLSI